MEDTKALIDLFQDVMEHKRREVRLLVIALVVSICMNIATVGAFLFYESGMETVSTTKTTTTEQEVNGDDGSIVNGNQYNGSE